MILRDWKNVNQEKRDKLRDTLLLISDEFSMITTELGEKLDQRFREVKECQEFMGGIPIIIFVGDGRQLPPGIGGVKTSIMAATVYGKSELGKNLRKFVRKTLTVQNRADKGDLWQAELLKHVNEVEYPITRALLASSCEFCLPSLPVGVVELPENIQRDPIPTRQCRHLHYLNTGIARAIPQLINAPVIYPGHAENDVIMVERIVAFAKFNSLPVFRWAKPAYGKEDNSNARLVFNLHNEFSKSASLNPLLFGYFVQGLPVRVNHNASLEGRVVNGTLGTLHSLRPANVSEVDNKVLEAKRPIGVYLDCPTAEECFRDGKVCFLSDASNDVKRREIITVVKKTSNTQRKDVFLSHSGYDSALGGTCYAFQGQTLPYVIFDLNYSYRNPITLAYFLVCISRIKDSMNCFVMLFIDEEKQKKTLFELKHPDEWYIWNAAYDENGIFQLSRIKPIGELCEKYNPKVNKISRPTSSSSSSSSSSSAAAAAAAATATATISSLTRSVSFPPVQLNTPLSAAAAATAVAEGSTVSVSKPQQPLPSLQNHGIEETIFPKLTGSMQQRLSVHFADDNIPIMNSVVVHSGGSSLFKFLTKNCKNRDNDNGGLT